MAYRWTCPYCSMVQTVVNQQETTRILGLHIERQAEGPIGIKIEAVGCSNPDCLRTTVTATISRTVLGEHGYAIRGTPLFKQRLLPQGTAKPQPEFIPQAIRDDYYEACLIRDLSPKASATLIRRCLQGMIRDFAGIAKARLIDEINALEKAVADGTADRAITPETVKAIDHVRGIGNIGAHMEKDISLIVEVDTGEAQALIELVEMLFEEWYVARESRKEKLARIASIADDKKARKAPPAPKPKPEGSVSDGAANAGNGEVNALLRALNPPDKKPDEN